MLNFQFACPTRIIFGKDADSNVAQEVKKEGNKILIHYGGGSIKKVGYMIGS